MTSTVKVTAHCATTKEVVLRIEEPSQGVAAELVVLQDGESREVYVYDARSVTVCERLKGT